MVPVDDAAALAAALAAVLDDRRLADELRSAGLVVAGRFSWARSAAQHQAIYRTAEGRAGRAANAPATAEAVSDGPVSGRPAPAPGPREYLFRPAGDPAISRYPARK